MLRVDRLTVAYGAIVALDAVSLDAEPGQIVSIIGANGAGKSSLLNAIGGFVRPQSGAVVVGGQDVTSTTIAQRVRGGIALVQEGRQIWSTLTVEEHLRLGARAAGASKAGYMDRLDRVFSLFPRVEERRKQLVGTLSGGEQQMVVIGRALMSGPRLLLLDEPTLGLAPAVLDGIATALRSMRSPDLTIVVAEQNAEFALDLADHGYVLEVGRNRMDGPARQLASDPQLLHAYLGESLA